MPNQSMRALVCCDPVSLSGGRLGMTVRVNCMTYCANGSFTVMVRVRHRPDLGSNEQPVYLFGSTMLRPFRLAYGLAPIIEILEEHGHQIEPLLARVNIPRFALEEPSYRIRFEQELTFIRLALEELKLPAAGLAVGQRYHLPLFGVLGLVANRTAPQDVRRELLPLPHPHHSPQTAREQKHTQT